VLLAVLAARRYRNGTHDGRLALYVWTCAAILSKEVALVTPVLVGIDAWCRRAASRRLVTDTAVLAAAAAVVGSVRLLFGSHLVHTHITRFMVQRWLFETFGALMLPFHLGVVPQQVILVSTAAVLVLASACWLSASRSAPGRVLAAPVGWILVSAAPMLTFLFVSPELEGARYVYLPSVGWAALLIVGATRRDEHWWRFPASTGLLIVIGCGIVATRVQLAPWTSAAATRDAVLRAAGRDHAFAGCDSVSILGLPDTVRGAYVLRNGASEAFGKPVEMRTSSSAADPCAFRWDGQAMISALHGGAMQP
jgi:hypothetical protein